jgi:hypothetical protein
MGIDCSGIDMSHLLEKNRQAEHTKNNSLSDDELRALV